MSGPRPKSLEEAWNYLLKHSRKENDCILYEKTRGIGIGYRTIRAGGVTWYVHHLSFFLAGKRLNQGEIRRHTCDRPSCITQDHIIAGTHADNVNDKVSRERQMRGSTHYKSFLTDTNVRDIRASTEKYEILSKRYGISRGGISNIKHRVTWKHIK